ncbi:aldose 1-epimerase family protein [Rhizobium sp. LjRoot30]|uniref:aldose 1-epimerase family protein n=1 Tax=Rhizobium sp. LjRoot30 TaxID=3342320 RepID=UPI003ECCBA7F
MIEFSATRGPRLTLDPTSVLDIGACIVHGENLAPGRAIPDDGDPRIDHSLEGFLFTCGPDHLRHPEPIEGDAAGRKYPLHGAFAAHPATIVSNKRENGGAECHAVVDVRMTEGAPARLERRWHIDGKTGEVQLDDRIVNTGDTPFPPMLMYHMNIGARLFDADVRLSGAMLEAGGFPWTFGKDPGGVFCVPAEGAEWAELQLGPMASLGGLSLRVAFRTDTLPFLQIWRNQAAPAHVLGIEPCSHRWVGRAELGRSGELTEIAPGESRSYGLRFSFV